MKYHAKLIRAFIPVKEFKNIPTTFNLISRSQSPVSGSYANYINGYNVRAETCVQHALSTVAWK